MKALKIIVIAAVLCIVGWYAVIRIGHAMFPEELDAQAVEAGRSALLEEAAKEHEREFFERKR